MDFPQIKEDLSNFVFQQGVAPPHWATEVHRFLNTELPRSWIGRSGPDDLILHSWPPRHAIKEIRRATTLSERKGGGFFQKICPTSNGYSGAIKISMTHFFSLFGTSLEDKYGRPDKWQISA
ncbi:hypothetical protein AVEN_98717-1 [Araneus ventricosus]|uniref:Uncharacterized protein n=1 Tax=Araneus ventricosus TaxID=182803 RepID=A0A4Y2HFX5_ARAVE|nr:hypothetical protein AVEN_98717-1 [Araneus ventricosus]